MARILTSFKSKANTILSWIGLILLGILGVALVIGFYWGLFWLISRIDTESFWAQRIIIFLLGLGGSALGILLARHLRENTEKKRLAEVIAILEKHIAQLDASALFTSASSLALVDVAPAQRYLKSELALPVLQAADAMVRITSATAPTKKEQEHLTRLYDQFVVPSTSILEEARKTLRS